MAAKGSEIGVAIVGAGGYAGAELADLLLGHGGARIVGLFASARREKGDQPGRFDELFPRFRGRLTQEVRPASVEAIAATGATVAMLATPHEASLELAPALLARGMVVLDLSAAFRLSDPGLYPTHYGFAHTRADLLASAVYGLVEVNRARLRSAELIAVPGCYPTSAILPLVPLVRAGAVRAGTRPIVDSVSGVSGAGRGLALGSLFCEVSVKAYNVLKHRHEPEIAEHAGLGAGGVFFTPHLGPYDRGIVSTIHVELAAGWNGERVSAALRGAYERERFVRLLPEEQWPSVADVRGTNFCDIGWKVDEARGHLVVSSAIDNLVKGAAGQAVQAMNVRMGVDEGEGLGA